MLVRGADDGRLIAFQRQLVIAKLPSFSCSGIKICIRSAADGSAATQLAASGVAIFIHRHYCPGIGHDWQCSDPTCECICGLLMEEGNHDDCPVELRACAKHFEGNVADNDEPAPNAVEIEFPVLPPEQQHSIPACHCGCAALTPGVSVGFCLWCDHRYEDYSPEIDARHFAEHCPGAPESLKQAATEKLAKRKTMRPVFEGKA